MDPPDDLRFTPLVAAVHQDLASNNATAASAAIWLDSGSIPVPWAQARESEGGR